MIGIKGTSQFIEGAVNTCNIRFAQDVYGISGGGGGSEGEKNDGSGALGALYAVMGVATLLGPLLAKRFTRETPRDIHGLFVGAFGVLVGGSMMLSLWENEWFFLLVNTVRSAGTSIIWVFASSLLQRISIDNFRGRAVAFDIAVSTTLQALGTILSGALLQLEWTPFYIVFVVAVLGACVANWWICYFLFYSHHYHLVVRPPPPPLPSRPVFSSRSL